jgi:hypothetical protein
MVCVSYVSITGNPSSLRLLVRRLKQRLPGVPLLVGLWPEGDAALVDASVQGAIGADYYAGSLRGAVARVLGVARDDTTLGKLIRSFEKA